MAGETPITIEGNLTADPDLRFAPNGDAVANVSIASTPRTFDRQSNEWKDGETLFMRGSIWRAMGENAAESLSKGDAVIATGKLKSRSYEKDGQTRTVMEMEIENIGPSLKFATAKPARVQRGNGQQRQGQQQGQQQQWQGQPQGGQQPAYGQPGGQQPAYGQQQQQFAPQGQPQGQPAGDPWGQPQGQQPAWGAQPGQSEL